MRLDIGNPVYDTTALDSAVNSVGWAMCLFCSGEVDDVLAPEEYDWTALESANIFTRKEIVGAPIENVETP